MSEAAQPEVGRVVDGKYRLTRLLGRGGMGSVWEGVHTSLGTRFALKYIDAAFAGRRDVQTRFANEALAAARLKSKHIVEVYDHGVDEHGAAYIVMEFLSGEPLDARLAREGRLSLLDTAGIVAQIGKALSRAHKAGIVHRDLKPENVFLVWDEEDQKNVVKVVDFGIAKFVDGTGVDTATRTGAVLGTPHFMSPEQARGLKDVGFSADIWSLGVIAYRCVTGRSPFEGEAVGDLLVKICTVPHAAPSSFMDVLPEFDGWIDRCLAKDPKDRFSSISEQTEALIELLRGQEPSLALSALSRDAESRAAFDMTTPMFDSPPFGSGSNNTNDGVERAPSDRSARSRVWVFPAIGGGVVLAALGLWQALDSNSATSSEVALASAATVAGEPSGAGGGGGHRIEPTSTAVPAPAPIDAGAGGQSVQGSGKAGTPPPSPRARRAPDAPAVPAPPDRPVPKPPRAANPQDELGY